MADSLRYVLLGLTLGGGYALARGFVQAVLDDWRSWRSRHRDVIINNLDLLQDSAFMLELDTAIRKSYERKDDRAKE